MGSGDTKRPSVKRGLFVSNSGAVKEVPKLRLLNDGCQLSVALMKWTTSWVEFQCRSQLQHVVIPSSAIVDPHF